MQHGECAMLLLHALCGKSIIPSCVLSTFCTAATLSISHLSEPSQFREFPGSYEPVAYGRSTLQIILPSTYVLTVGYCCHAVYCAAMPTT
jgi:hypothetical protein